MSDYRYQIVEHNGIECLHVMSEAHKERDGIAHTYIPLDSIKDSIREYYDFSEVYSNLDYVDGKMQMLGSSLNLADPDGAISRKGYSSDAQRQVWEAVRDDYRQLSDAILALRKKEGES